MKKELLLLSTLFLFSFTLFSQKAKTQNEPVFKNKKEKLTLPPALRPFEKGDSYAYNIPLEIKGADESFDPFFVSEQKNAKSVHLSKNPKYVFHFSSSLNIEEGEEIEIEYSKLKQTSSFHKFINPNDYVGMVELPINFKITITDQKGDTIKEIVLLDDERRTLFYIVKGLYKKEICALPTTELRNNAQGYKTPQEAHRAYKHWLKISNSSLYKYAIFDARERANDILRMLFLETKKCNLYIKALSKRDKKIYPDLDEKIEEFKSLCAQWAKNPKDSENLRRIEKLTNYFSEKRFEIKDEKLRELLQLNAGIGYLMQGEFGYGIRCSQEAIEKESRSSELRTSIPCLYKIFRTYNTLSQDEKTVYVPRRYDYFSYLDRIEL